MFMKKIILFLVVLIVFVSCKEKKQLVTTQQNIFTAIVNDLSNIFTQTQRDSLTNKILQYEKQTTNEIAVVTLDSIDGTIEIYSLNLANEMGIGKRDKDNGLLILLLKSLRKVKILTAIETRRILTDSICQEIIDRRMIPEFKKGDFYKGIDTAIDDIILKWTNE